MHICMGILSALQHWDPLIFFIAPMQFKFGGMRKQIYCCKAPVVECKYKYIYSSTVLKCNFEIFVLYLSISTLCCFILMFHYISEENMILFTSLDVYISSIYSI